jgi:hypothetical protein
MGLSIIHERATDQSAERAALAAPARFRLIVGAVGRVKGFRGTPFGSVILVRLPAPFDAPRVSTRKL